MAVAKISTPGGDAIERRGEAIAGARRGRSYHHDLAAYIVGLQLAADSTPRAELAEAT